MSDSYVFDSFAILAFLCGEPGGGDVSRLLREGEEGRARLLMTWVNMGEVAYIIERRWGRMRLLQVLASLEATAIEFISVGRELALAAARVKAQHALAYADAIAAALALDQKATLVTGDPEIRALEGVLRVRWLEQET